MSPQGISSGKFRLLRAFEDLFRDKPYRHRDSSLGNFVALHLYEDLYEGKHSPKFNRDVDTKACVVNIAGSTRGVKARRGDGTFGRVVPAQQPSQTDGLMVWQGMVALSHVGIEVKIIAKVPLKQIDRVLTDLTSSAKSLKESSDAITVGIGAVNYSETYTGFEGTREFVVTRKPEAAAREAHEACRRLERIAKPAFDEFLLFRFKATNQTPFPFLWLDSAGVEADYAAALLRVSNQYEKRF